MRRPLLALTLTLAVLPASASADPPKAGKRYDGKVGSAQRGFVAVSRSGNRLADYTFAARMRCSDGKSRPLGFSRPGEPATPITPDGRFSYDAPFEKVHGPLKGEAGATAASTFLGRFEDGGDSVSGTVRMRYRWKRVTCDSGAVPFAFYRDGTPRAPFRTRSIATGLYAGRNGDLRSRMRVLAPARAVLAIRLRYRARCRRAGPVGFNTRLVSLPIRGARIAERRTILDRGHGLRYRGRVRLTGRFFRRGGAYRFSGRFISRTVVRRGGRRVDSCTSGSRRVRIGFRRGPRAD